MKCESPNLAEHHMFASSFSDHIGLKNLTRTITDLVCYYMPELISTNSPQLTVRSTEDQDQEVQPQFR